MSGDDLAALYEGLFWDWVEEAWAQVPDGHALRGGILAGRAETAGPTALDPLFAALRAVLDARTPEGVVAFARELARARWRLDSQALAQHIGLGDDGFSDARATIVYLGARHYRRVQADLCSAVPWLAIERASYFFDDYCEARFGGALGSFGFDPTTASNPAGWPNRHPPAGRR